MKLQKPYIRIIWNLNPKSTKIMIFHKLQMLRTPMNQRIPILQKHCTKSKTKNLQIKESQNPQVKRTPKILKLQKPYIHNKSHDKSNISWNVGSPNPKIKGSLNPQNHKKIICLSEKQKESDIVAIVYIKKKETMESISRVFYLYLDDRWMDDFIIFF